MGAIKNLREEIEEMNKMQKKREDAIKNLEGLKDKLGIDHAILRNYSEYFRKLELAIFKDVGFTSGFARLLCLVMSDITELFEYINENERETSDN